MPIKPVSARSRLLAYFATAPLVEVNDVLEDGRAVLTERRRLAGSGGGQTSPKAPVKAKVAPKTKTPAAAPNVDQL